MIAVVGLGPVGLTSALGFAELGHDVRGFDTNTRHAEALRAARLPYLEPGLDVALEQHVNRRLRVCASLQEAVADADVVFLCVPTPPRLDGSADTSRVDEVTRLVAHQCSREHPIIAVRSTIPPGTIDTLEAALASDSTTRRVRLAANPEFLREGQAWRDFLEPGRVVIGSRHPSALDAIEAVYRRLDGVAFFRVRPATAELAKHASNALLATLVSFANEMQIISGAIEDVDVVDMFRILQRDPRWTGSPATMAAYTHPGFGFGGPCLPKDVAALAHFAEENGVSAPLLNAVVAVNDGIATDVVRRIAGEAECGQPIGVLGLSFKPGSNDVRNTPSRQLIENLQVAGFGEIWAYDPMAVTEFREAFSLDVRYARSAEEVLDRCPAVVLAVPWPELVQAVQSRDDRKVFDLRYALAR